MHIPNKTIVKLVNSKLNKSILSDTILIGIKLIEPYIQFNFPIELKDRLIYYQDEDIAQFEKETGKNASVMGRETRKFLMYLKKKFKREA